MVTLGGVAAMAIACLMIVLVRTGDAQQRGVPLTLRGLQSGVGLQPPSIGRDHVPVPLRHPRGGSLLQEKAKGTAGFTLSLPVSRGRIVFWRAVLGFAGVVAIALIR